jgi:hypothetical protein
MENLSSVVRNVCAATEITANQTNLPTAHARVVWFLFNAVDLVGEVSRYFREAGQP